MSDDEVVAATKTAVTAVVKTVETKVKSVVDTVVSCAKTFYDNTIKPAANAVVSFYNEHSDLIHTGLDILGSLPIPYVSTIADGVNAGLYLLEGNYVEAASSALNMLPGGGVIGKVKKIGEKIVDVVNVGRSVKSGDYLSAAMGALSFIPGSKNLPDNSSGSKLGIAAGGLDSGSSNNKILWGSWDDYDHVTLNNNEYAEVGERLYTRHAVARMQPSGMRYTNTSAGGKVKGSRILNAGEYDYGRSISPNYVEDVINSGTTSTQVVDNVTRTIFSSGTVDVVTEQNGKIVVTILTH